MRAFVFLVTCLAILITTSCGDKAVTPYQPSETETRIIGNWLWQESCGGIAGTCTDSSAFGSEGISFTKDGIFYAWCDVCDPLELEYSVVRKKSYIYGPDTIVDMLVIGSTSMFYPQQIIRHLDDSSLTLVQDCFDCYENYYSRIRTTDPIIVDPGGVGP